MSNEVPVGAYRTYVYITVFFDPPNKCLFFDMPTPRVEVNDSTGVPPDNRAA